MNFQIPNDVLFILDRLNSRGFSADIVGGSVRDLLLGRSPDDYDITTSARPEEIKAAFADLRTIDTGIKHGTVGILLNDKVYETTTYRVDGEYKDSRHPESVSFTRDIVEDLARRDFTINSMAYSPKNGLTDPFDGQNDLANGIIRAVGDPMLRFSEDALRILRGIRFAATFGFEIEPMTSAALREKANLLSNVSAERIYVELRKTFDKPHSYGVVSEYSGVILSVMAGLDSLVLPEKDAYDSADCMSRILSIFFLSSENPSHAFDIFATTLKTDSHFRRFGSQVLMAVGKYDLTDSLGLTKCLRDNGEEATHALVNLEKALGHNADSDLLSKLLNSGVCYRISDLKVGGADMKNIGLTGPKIGEALDRLLTAVIEGRVENEREALIEFLKTN